MSASKSVSIGGRPYTVARFKTYKAVLVGEVVSNVTKEVRQLFKEAQDFRREYREQNPLQITRQVCVERANELEAAAASSRERAEAAPVDPREGEESRQDWLDQAKLLEARRASWQRQLEDMGERGYIEIPQDPADEEVILAVFPRAFLMKRELSELLALIVTPDSDLKAEWRQGSVHDKLRETGEQLIEDSEPEEIVELALAAKEIVGDQFRPLGGKLRTIWERSETPQPEPPQTPQPQPPSQPPPTSSSPTSSTSSEEPTDGESRSPSLESRGEPALPSPAA